MKRILPFVFGWLFSFPMVSFAQSDTLRLTLAQAEAQFRQNNLQLIATKLGVNENQAYEFQAKLWNNPNIYIEQMPYNHQTKEVMPLRQQNSEQVIQLQQLLLLAGKRNKQLAIARTNTEIANDRFYDLLRTLNYQLRTTFYDLYYTQQALNVYEQETSTLRQTVNLFQEQYDKGNVPLKDLTRLKAYLFNLTNERQQLLRKLTDDQADLAVLLNASPSVPLKPLLENTEAIQPAVGQLSADELIKQATENRFDLKAFRDQAMQEKQNLALQKALAVPDLTVQATYDRNAGYIPNYVGIGVGINLPVFNKNQGNIKAATIRTESSQKITDAYTLQVESDVQRAFKKVQQTDQLYRTFDQKFNSDFSRLIDGVITNYRKQNIDVVEFLDFFDSYKASQIQYNQLQNDRMQSLEELNFAVGTNLFTK
ncbi:TolC family protein [Larkinella terrae]|uniref:TolC family protein n=1 Tax=Larkinella terrae TaxID=2025311 RepID=A0A7K0ETW6_9BACT|nr:TolC family protein [Larkinella terrae]MRS65257.1 TolC family protein [Larkinella terrae]